MKFPNQSAAEGGAVELLISEIYAPREWINAALKYGLMFIIGVTCTKNVPVSLDMTANPGEIT